MEPHEPPFLRWYDPNSHCDYHCGAQRYSIKNCLPLKYKVQLLIKVGWLDFNKNNGPNMIANSLPNHVRPNINAVMEESSMKIKTTVDEIKSSMDKVYRVMVRMGAIPKMKFLKEVVAIAKRRV